MIIDCALGEKIHIVMLHPVIWVLQRMGRACGPCAPWSVAVRCSFLLLYFDRGIGDEAKVVSHFLFLASFSVVAEDSGAGRTSEYNRIGFSGSGDMECYYYWASLLTLFSHGVAERRRAYRSIPNKCPYLTSSRANNVFHRRLFSFALIGGSSSIRRSSRAARKGERRKREGGFCLLLQRHFTVLKLDCSVRPGSSGQYEYAAENFGSNVCGAGVVGPIRWRTEASAVHQDARGADETMAAKRGRPSFIFAWNYLKAALLFWFPPFQTLIIINFNKRRFLFAEFLHAVDMCWLVPI